MADLHCRTRIRTLTLILNPMATWYCVETFHIGSDPFPKVFLLYRDPSPSPDPAM